MIHILFKKYYLKLIIVCFLIFHASPKIYSQETIVTVVDCESNLPLQGATLYINNLPTKLADGNGIFRLPKNLIKSNEQLKISYIGYSDIFINQESINKEKMRICMQKRLVDLADVQIKHDAFTILKKAYAKASENHPINAFYSIVKTQFTMENMDTALYEIHGLGFQKTKYSSSDYFHFGYYDTAYCTDSTLLAGRLAHIREIKDLFSGISSVIYGLRKYERLIKQLKLMNYYKTINGEGESVLVFDAESKSTGKTRIKWEIDAKTKAFKRIRIETRDYKQSFLSHNRVATLVNDYEFMKIGDFSYPVRVSYIADFKTPYAFESILSIGHKVLTPISSVSFNKITSDSSKLNANKYAGSIDKNYKMNKEVVDGHYQYLLSNFSDF